MDAIKKEKFRTGGVTGMHVVARPAGRPHRRTDRGGGGGAGDGFRAGRGTVRREPRAGPAGDRVRASAVLPGDPVQDEWGGQQSGSPGAHNFLGGSQWVRPQVGSGAGAGVTKTCSPGLAGAGVTKTCSPGLAGPHYSWGVHLAAVRAFDEGFARIDLTFASGEPITMGFICVGFRPFRSSMPCRISCFWVTWAPVGIS